MKIDPSLVFVVGLIAALVLLIAASYILPAKRRKQSVSRMEELKSEALAFVERCTKDGYFPSPATNLILRGDEMAVLDEASTLFESRAYRVGGGAGTRIGRVWVGGGGSESQQRLKQGDAGRLKLT